MERFTKEELEKWWHAQCPKCGWDGLSRDCAGGEPIADTGDFGDPLCPMCIKKDDYVVVDDYAEPDAQATIAALQADNRTYINERHENTKQIEQLQADLAQRTAELEAAKAELNTVRRDAGLDCGDNSCLYAMNKTGMRTNGGCRCSPKRMKDDLGRSRKACDDLQAELERVRAVSNPCSKIFTHKWLDPECVENGCQSLKLKHRQGMEG